MPYVGRLPALIRGQPILIVGFDAAQVLAVTTDGRLQYFDHTDVEIPWHSDAEAVYWLEFGYVVENAARDDDDDGSGEPPTD